jgi:putative oxidoreductase
MKKSLRLLLYPASYGKKGDTGILVLRLFAGFIMVYAHGWGKLTHFGENSDDFYNFLGLGGTVSFGLVVFAEFFCSVLLLLGLGTRLATFPLLITMIVIVVDVNAGKPINKFETPLLYLVIYISLLITGAGKYSLDYLLFSKKDSTGYR